jgi:MFS family permease
MRDDGRPAGANAPAREDRADRFILYASRTVRAFGAGALAVALALDLGSAYSALLAGIFLALSMVGASVWALAAGRIERAIGRRRAFVLSAVSLAVGGLLLFEWVASPLIVCVALLLGGILASSSDIGPLPSLEQATLASVVQDRSRTRTFVEYNLLGYLGSAAGALAAPPLMTLGQGSIAGPRDLVLLVYGLLGFLLVPIYLRFSSRADRPPEAVSRAPLSPVSRSRISTLSALFSADAFGGGLVANFLVTLWLRARYGASGETIGIVLALAMAGAAVSLLLASSLASRYGLVNTMVFTHMPSSVILVLFAFAPSVAAAGALWVGRSFLSQMDVPTRQSLIQAIVEPEERTTAAGYTTAARSSAALGGPVTGGFLALGGPWLAAPFVLAGSVKIAYDGALYLKFRRVPVREETGSRGAPPVRPDA